MKALAVEDVGQRIVEWYSCIITKDIKQAKELKPEVDLMIVNMEPDDKMLAYYQLVTLQHDLLLLKVEPDKHSITLDESILENIAVQANDYLNFMYYYVWGQTEFYHKRYKSAIRTYKIAERLIEKVKDPAEKAEFYQRLGQSYYQIDQYTFAFSYIEQALEFFEKNSSYVINVISCKQILAGIYNELDQFEKATEIFDELLILSQPFNYYTAMTYYNMGVIRIDLQKYSEALIYFNKALKFQEFYDSPTGLKAQYYVFNLQYRLGNTSKSIEEFQLKVHNKGAVDLTAKLLVCRGLYLEDNHSLVKEGMDILESNEFFFDCHEISQEISKHYKKKRDFETALIYSEYAIEMGKRKTILGVDQT